MTILLLDARWPTLIPAQAYGVLASPVVYTSELSQQVRKVFDDLVGRSDPTGVGVIVTTNAKDPVVVRRMREGEQLIEAASRAGISGESVPADSVAEAVDVMAAARCRGEWEMSQTHASLLPFLEEETREFAEAVHAEASDAELCQELGDVLLQVLFHADIAASRGAFDFFSVAASFVAKMRSRAPYLFDGSEGVVPIERQEELWAAGKRAEKSASDRAQGEA